MVEVINIRVPREFARHIAGVDARMKKAVREGLSKAAADTAARARTYAPISPLQGQLNKAMTMWRPLPGNANFLIKKSVRATKNKDGTWTYRKAKKHEVTIKHRGRKADAVRAMPGGLEKSISHKVEGNEGHVFVAENSASVSVSKKTGRRFNYATVIHDGKGKNWHNRGLGTVAKGVQADEKFIERALKDNKGRNKGIIDIAIRKAFA